MTSLGFYWTDWRVFSRVTSYDSQPVDTYVKLSLGDKNGLYTQRNLPSQRKTSQKANYLEELYGKQLGDGWEVSVFLWVLIRESTRVNNARGGILRQIGKLDSRYPPSPPETRVWCFWVQPWWVYICQMPCSGFHACVSDSVLDDVFKTRICDTIYMSWWWWCTSTKFQKL